MRDLTTTTDFGVAADLPSDATVIASPSVTEKGVTEFLPVLEETLQVSKRRVVTGRVTVSTRTETHDEIAESTLDRTAVDVVRVPIGRFVDVAPSLRTEGDTTIMPVIEERLVLVKRLFLIEEVHVRHHIERETVREMVSLRRQQATVERVDVDGGSKADAPAEISPERHPARPDTNN